VTDTISELRALLLEVGIEDEVSAGTWLWREGDPGDEVVVVKEGRLQVVPGGAEGEAVPLRDLPPGVLGEIACLDGESRSAGVRTITDCRLSRVPAAQFRELLRRYPSILEALLLQQVRIVRSLTGPVTRTHRHAITDPLTRLYNFGFFSDRLSSRSSGPKRPASHLNRTALSLGALNIKSWLLTKYVLNVSAAGTADGANVDQWSGVTANQEMFQLVSVP
jgi:CRP-like cAMP-binding protein